MTSIKPYIIQGVKLFLSRDYVNAYNEFRKAASLYPQSDEANTAEGKYVYADAMRWKGLTEMKLGMLDDAIRTFKYVISSTGLRTPEIVYYLCLARYYYSFFLKAGWYSTLVDALNDLRTISPITEMEKVTALRAMIHAEIGELREAEGYMNAIPPNKPIIHLVKAHILRLKGRLDEALYEIDTLLQTEPDNIDALIEKALILKGQGKYQDTLKVLNYVLSIEPTNVLAKFFMAEALELMGLTNDALKIYAEIDKLLYSDVIKMKLQPQQRTAPQSVFRIPSRPMNVVKQTSWDPKVWVGKTFSVYKVIDVLGEGGNGYVLKGEGPGGEEVAIKVLKIQSGLPDDYFDTLVAEASNLTSVSNDPNIVKIYAIYVDKLILKRILAGDYSLYEKSPPMIVMELMKGGTLHDLVNDDSFFYSSKWVKTVYRAIATVAEALNKMHSSGYVHMDVKPQNIFLTERPKYPDDLTSVNFKLGDLGSAVRIGGKITQLTVEYAPPEAYTDTAKPYLDIFALGITMYVLLTRKLDRPDLQDMNEAFDCYVNKDFNCVKDKVNTARYKLKGWDPNVPSEVKPLLKAMVDPEPLRRPTAKDVNNYLTKLF